MTQVVEWGWVATIDEREELRNALEDWLARRLPYRLEIADHEELTTENITAWFERHATGRAFAGLLEGDDGPAVVHFEKSQDAVLFKMTWM